MHIHKRFTVAAGIGDQIPGLVYQCPQGDFGRIILQQVVQVFQFVQVVKNCLSIKQARAGIGKAV